MILIPQYRTARRAAGGAVEVVQFGEMYASRTTPFVFPSTPANGDLIVIVRHRPAIPSSAITAGFSEVYTAVDTRDPQMFVKTAGASESNSYEFTASSATDIFTIGLCLRNVGSYSSVRVANDAAGTTLTIPASGQSVSAGSAVIAIRVAGSTPSGNPQGVGSQSYDSGWGLVSKDLEETNGMVLVLYKEFASAASSQTVTNSWTTSLLYRRGYWVEFAL